MTASNTYTGRHRRKVQKQGQRAPGDDPGEHHVSLAGRIDTCKKQMCINQNGLCCVGKYKFCKLPLSVVPMQSEQQPGNKDTLCEFGIFICHIFIFTITL